MTALGTMWRFIVKKCENENDMKPHECEDILCLQGQCHASF